MGRYTRFTRNGRRRKITRADLKKAYDLLKSGTAPKEVEEAMKEDFIRSAAKEVTEKALAALRAQGRSSDKPDWVLEAKELSAGEASWGPELERIKNEALKQQRSRDLKSGGMYLADLLEMYPDKEDRKDIEVMLNVGEFRDRSHEAVVPPQVLKNVVRVLEGESSKLRRAQKKGARRPSSSSKGSKGSIAVAAVLREFDIPEKKAMQALKKVLTGKRNLPISRARTHNELRQNLEAIERLGVKESDLTPNKMLTKGQAHKLRRLLLGMFLQEAEAEMRKIRSRLGSVKERALEKLRPIFVNPWEKSMLGGAMVRREREKWGPREYDIIVSVVEDIQEAALEEGANIAKLERQLEERELWRNQDQEYSLKSAVQNLINLATLTRDWLKREGSPTIREYFLRMHSEELPLIPPDMFAAEFQALAGFGHGSSNLSAAQRARLEQSVLAQYKSRKKRGAIEYRLEESYTTSERDLVRSLVPIFEELTSAYSFLYKAVNGGVCDFVLTKTDAQRWRQAKKWMSLQAQLSQVNVLVEKEGAKNFADLRRIWATKAQKSGSPRDKAVVKHLKELALALNHQDKLQAAAAWQDSMYDILRGVSSQEPDERTAHLLEACEGRPIYVIDARGGQRVILDAILPWDRRAGMSKKLRMSPSKKAFKRRGTVVKFSRTDLANIQDKAALKGVPLEKAASDLGIEVMYVAGSEQEEPASLKALAEEKKRRRKEAKTEPKGGPVIDKSRLAYQFRTRHDELLSQGRDEEAEALEEEAANMGIDIEERPKKLEPTTGSTRGKPITEEELFRGLPRFPPKLPKSRYRRNPSDGEVVEDLDYALLQMAWGA